LRSALKKEPSLFVTGLARNVSRCLRKEVLRINQIMANFYGKIEFYIVESDSTDDTQKILERLALELPNFNYSSLGKLESTISNRIERLRFCRNNYVETFRKTQDKFSEVLVIDFDIKNNRLNRNSMQEVLSQNLNWDGLFANQTGRYFDILALRKDGWVMADCMREVQELMTMGYEKEKAKELAVWAKMKRIQKYQNPIEVNSAFGGMALYKNWVMHKFDYSVSSTSVESYESEHVALNYKIRADGGQLFIHPQLLNFSWNPHNLASIKVLRRLDQLTKRNRFGLFRKLLRSRLG
jgi:glycosyltransferase involved in cell wall biosynthesis